MAGGGKFGRKGKFGGASDRSEGSIKSLGVAKDGVDVGFSQRDADSPIYLVLSGQGVIGRPKFLSAEACEWLKANFNESYTKALEELGKRGLLA